MLFPVLYGGAKLVMRVPAVRAEDMDFETHVAEFEAMMYVASFVVVNGCVA